MRSVSDLQRAAKGSGCKLRAVRRLPTGVLRADWDCPDLDEGMPFATAQLLDELTAQDPEVDALPRGIVRRLARSSSPARAAHAYVIRHVRFADERVETFASPTITLGTGAGDCDDSERVLRALAAALKVPSRYVFFTQGGQPAHVTVQLWTGRGWRWAETSVAARFGEHPFAAMRRLGLRRADLDGGIPWILANGKPRRLGSTTMGAMGDLPAYLGATFPSDLVAWSKSIGAVPLDVVKLLLSESGLQPSARNGHGFADGEFAAGINQLAPVNWHFFAPLTADQYVALTADQQLPYVFAYFAAVMKGHGLSSISGRDLYWLNFLPATFVPYSTDDHVIVTSSSGYYANNTGLDHGGKGYITAGDLQAQLDAQASSSLYPALAPAVVAAQGGALAPVTEGPALEAPSAVVEDLEGQGGATTAQAVAVVGAAVIVGVALLAPELVLDLWEAVT